MISLTTVFIDHLLLPMGREAVIQIGSWQLNVPRSRKSFVTFTCNADG